MVDEERIKHSLERSCEYLAKTQNQDGSWTSETTNAKYQLYQHPLILTSQGTQALILRGSPKYVQNIRSGLKYCFNSKIDDKADIDLHAWRLSALNYSTSDSYLKEQKRVSEFITNLQSKKGCWDKFPETNLLTNFSVTNALKFHKPSEEVKKKTISWVLANQSKDKLGWSFEPNGDEASPNTTTLGILTLLLCEWDISSHEFQKAKDFVSQSQKSNGAWETQVSTKDTPYATALATLELILTSRNPFNEQVEKGVEYLLNCQSEGGYFSETLIHYNYFISLLFSFYLYLKNKWNSSLDPLKLVVPIPQYLTVYLFKEFQNEVHKNLNLAVLTSILNSRVLGTTQRAVKRRSDILKILSTKGVLNVAEIVDALKEQERYKHLKKRSHLTQIKSDVEHLKSLKVVQEENRKYYVSFRVF